MSCGTHTAETCSLGKLTFPQVQIPTRIYCCLSAGPEGGIFKGVVAHINGYTSVPVATLRELLASRGGLVEAYNTSRCTHMICEALPYAKIKELRKVSSPHRLYVCFHPYINIFCRY